MDDHHERNSASAATDQTQDTTGVAKGSKTVDRRIQRLQDLYVQALEEPDPLRANLRAAMADLLEIGYRLGSGIKVAMGSESTGLELYKDVMPAIGSMALVHRQATRYIQLDRDQASGEDSGQGAKLRRRNSGVETGEMEI
jgi:hypothetical protein